jgi:lactoylglutathione lyase
VIVVKAKFEYVGIRVTNMDKSIGFYTKMLGMKLQGRSKNDETRGETAGLQSPDGNFTLELNCYEKDSPYNYAYTVGEGLDHLAFKVDDLKGALEEASKAGYPTVLRINSDGGEYAYIEDPDGIWIELF